MAEDLHINGDSKEEKYLSLIPQIKSLVEGESDSIANMANICAALTYGLNNEVIIVDDVDAFPGHIACSSLSKSEIVLPIYNSKKEIIGVLDVDSNEYKSFDKTDELFLNQILKMIEQ